MKGLAKNIILCYFIIKLFYSIMAAAGAPPSLKYTVLFLNKKNDLFPRRATTVIIRDYNGTKRDKYIDMSHEDMLQNIRENLVSSGIVPAINQDYQIAVDNYGYDEAYHISSAHPNIMDFDSLYEAGKEEEDPFGGSRRRRRPSRKYKKSKRVLRRKSRSTRRR